MDDEGFEDLKKLLAALRKDGKFRYADREGRRWEEKDDACCALVALGIQYSDLMPASPGDDPPDLTCYVNGERWGIEVTELIHEPVMQARIKGDHGLHHEWSTSEIVDKLNQLIARKDRGVPKSGAYAEYLLVIRTEEMHMERDSMVEILAGFEVCCSLITRACLAYSYHHRSDDSGVVGYSEYPALSIRVNRKLQPS